MRSFIKSFVLLAVLAGLALPGASRAQWADSVSSTLRFMNRRMMVPELARSTSHTEPWPGEDPLTSSLEVRIDGPAIAGSLREIRVVYTAGKSGISRGGGIRIAFEHGADWGRLQINDPKKENFAALRGPVGVTWKLNPNYMLGVCTFLEVLVESGKVEEGETVAMVLGGKAGGSPGFQVPTVSEVPGAGRLRAFEDRTGSGNFYEMPGIPEIEILPGLPHHLRALARSWAVVGGPVDVKVHAADEYNNVVTSFRGWFTVMDLESGERLGEVRIRPEEGGVAAIQGVDCPKEGILRLRIKSVAGGLAAVTNPIECVPQRGSTVAHFGSIHNHSLASDGLNTPEGATRYARDVSNLDFFALTDHVTWPDWDYDPVLLRHAQNEKSWNEAARIAREFNQPGEFATLLGFEWSTSTYGDKCFYFKNDTAAYRRFPPDQQGFYRTLGDDPVTVITHTMMGISGMRGPRWEYFDPHYEKVVEIASYHGVREYAGNVYPLCESDALIPAFAVRGNLVDGALGRGYKLGFVAGADDHSGKPGAGVKGILSCSINGLVGLRMPELSREAVFDAIENRATYATTGARIIMDFSVNGRSMGQEFSLPKRTRRAVRAQVHGEAPISEIAIIRQDPEEPVQVWKFNPPVLDPGKLNWTDDSTLRAPTWYYLRVIQVDNQMAWSSPVFVEPM